MSETIELSLDQRQLESALRARCDVDLRHIPFFRRPTTPSKPFAVRFAKKSFIVWKWENGSPIKCIPRFSRSGVTLKVSPTLRSRLPSVPRVVAMLMLIGSTVSLIGAITQKEWTDDLWLFVVVWAMILWANVMASIVSHADKRFRDSANAETRAMLSGLGSGSPVVAEP